MTSSFTEVEMFSEVTGGRLSMWSRILAASIPKTSRRARPYWDRSVLRETSSSTLDAAEVDRLSPMIPLVRHRSVSHFPSQKEED